MLPAWATIAIALGGSLIGAAAGIIGAYFTLRGAMLNIRSAETEAWRTRLIEAAQQFSGSWTEVAYLAARPLLSGKPLSSEARQTLSEANTRLVERTMLVRLVFGPDTPPGKAAEQARNEVFNVVRFAGRLGDLAAEELAAASKEANDASTKSIAAHYAFLAAAHAAMRPTGADR